jgi:hypothetical protein
MGVALPMFATYVVSCPEVLSHVRGCCLSLCFVFPSTDAVGCIKHPTDEKTASNY